MHTNKLHEIIDVLFSNIKDPQIELCYSSEYAFVVAVMLSAQSTDKQVNKITAQLFAKYPTIDDILAITQEQLEQHVKSIGLYRNKAKNILKMSDILKHKYNSVIPNSREDLMSLPGIGRKSANVILNELFGRPTIAVDTHILRLSNRLGFSKSNDPIKVEQDLESIVPEKRKKNIGNVLILHGRYTCTAKRPKCSNCCIRGLCDFTQNCNIE